VQTIAKSLKKGFGETEEVLQEIYYAIQPFEPVHTSYFTELYDKKQEIEKRYLNQVALETAMQKSEREVQAAIDTKNLNNQF